MSRFACLAMVFVCAGLLAGCASSSAAPSVSASLAPPTSEAEALQRNYECLTEKGWDVAVRDGGIEAEFPNDQGDQYQQYLEDSNECGAVTGTDGSRELTEADYEKLYQDRLAVRECLVSKDYPVGDVPSYQAFKDSYGADSTWDPYGQVSVDQGPAAVEACPQTASVY